MKSLPPMMDDVLLLPRTWCTMSCVVPVEVKDLLLREAEDRGLSISQVVQQALYAHYRPDINRILFGDLSPGGEGGSKPSTKSVNRQP